MSIIHKWARPVYPIDINDPSLVLYAPLSLDSPELTGATTLYSQDLNHHTMTNTGSIWGTTGRVFNGNDDIDIVNVLTTSLASTTAGTIIVWAAPDDTTPTGNEYFCAFGDTDIGTYIFLRYAATTGLVQAAVGLGGAAYWALQTDANPFTGNGSFDMISVVQNGTSPLLFVNDTQPDQTFTVTLDKRYWFNDCTGLDNGYVGVRSWAGDGLISYLNGKIGEIFIYNRLLTLAEIQQLFLTTRWRYK